MTGDMNDDLVCVPSEMTQMMTWFLFCLPGSAPVDGTQLEIKEDMIGDNIWKCQAHNGGDAIEQEIEFVVGKFVLV